MRVVVADDSVLLREGVVRLLEEKGFDVVAQAGDAEDLIRKVNAHKPDVAVVDIRMPPTNTDDGLRAALEIRAELPDTGVLVLSQYVEEGYALDLVGESAGGVGYHYPHGIRALIVVPLPRSESISSRPSSTAILSARPRRPVPRPGSAPPTPSSATSTTTRPLSRSTWTVACEASEYLATFVSPSATTK